MQRVRGWFLLPAIAVTLLAGEARAGVVVHTESESTAKPAAAAPGAAKQKQTPRYEGQFFVEGDRVRLQGTSNEADGASEGTVLFRSAPEALIFLDAGNKSYMEMTHADAKRIGTAIENARKQMQAQLQKMTPEQRAVFEQAMAGAGGAELAKASKPRKAPEPAKVVATGATDKIGDWACKGYDVLRGGKKVAEACVAAWGDLGFTQADVEGLRKLAAYQQQLFDEVNLEGFNSAPGSEAFEVMEQLGGFPVRVRTLIEGKPPVAMRVVKVERKAIDPKLFEVPPGYSKRDMAAEE
jgi:hypothetical protein